MRIGLWQNQTGHSGVYQRRFCATMGRSQVFFEYRNSGTTFHWQSPSPLHFHDPRQLHMDGFRL